LLSPYIHSTQYEFIAVNGQTTTSAFHKVVQQQYLSEVGETIVIYVTFLSDVARQKLLKSANVSRSYLKNNIGTVFFETRCSFFLFYILLGLDNTRGFYMVQIKID